MNMHPVFATAAEQLPAVRYAVPADLPELLQMGRDLHAENGLLTLSEEKIRDMAHKGVAGEDGRIGVIGPTGAIEGMIHLVIGSYWYSDDFHLEELYSYVRPECRRSKNARDLIEFAKKCATLMKVPLLIGIVSNNHTKQKIELYKRALGEPSGAYFIWGARTGSN